MGEVVAAWFGLLFGMTGVGVLLGWVFKFLSASRGGLR